MKQKGEFSTEHPLRELLGFVELRERTEERLRSRTSRAIKEAREAAGVSQSSLAAWLGTSQSYVSQVESGVKAVSTSQLRNFYAALDVVAAGPTGPAGATGATGGGHASSEDSDEEDDEE